jgi:DNA-binding NtrC family response regulator
MTRRQSFDLCLVSLHLGHRNGIDLLVQMKAQHYTAPVVLLAGGDELDGLPVPRQVECLDRDRLTPAMLQQVLRDAMFQTTTEAGAPLTSPGELLVPAKHQPVAR